MCCRSALVVSLLIAVNSHLVCANECGTRIALTQGLVHFGTPSRLGEWPWHVALFHRIKRASPSYACGGTIVAKNFVLTAAHCTYPQSRVRPLKAAEILIRAGIANLQQLEHSLQQLGLTEIVRQDEYNTDTLESDIALLKLAADLEFTNYVKPICLWDGSDAEDLIVGQDGFIAGWGQDENLELTDLLKHAVMPIISRKTCRDSDPDYYTRYLYDRKTFCAGYRNGTSAGLGDSGGGLYIERSGKWQLRGIVSNGKYKPESQILDTSHYIVFTDVLYYKPWIKKVLNIDDGPSTVITTPDYGICGMKKEPKFSRTGHREERKWPWHAEIYRHGKKPTRLCEVALISEYFMLSPAEVYSEGVLRDPSKLLAVFRAFKNGKIEVLHHQRIARIVRHENFEAGPRKHNIALLELTTPIHFTELIRPICLWRGVSDSWVLQRATGFLGDEETSITDKDSCLQRFQFYKMKGPPIDHYFCYTLSWYSMSGKTIGDMMYLKFDGSWYLRGIPFNKTEIDSTVIVQLVDVTYYQDWIDRAAVPSSQDLLASGNCADPRSSNWMYQIKSQHKLQCYSSLVSPNLLLTTASCVESLSVDSLSILNDHYGHIANVSKVHLHKSFDPTTLSNNLALVQLTQPMDKTPVCLPKSTEKVWNIPLQACSWQAAASRANPVYHGLNNFSSSNLQSCRDMWKRDDVHVDVDGGHICGHIEAEQGLFFNCPIDLHGAPLVYKDPSSGSLFLRGVLDVGKNNHCNRDSQPEVYIDVMFHAHWIGEVVAKTSPKASAGSSSGDTTTREEWRVVPSPRLTVYGEWGK